MTKLKNLPPPDGQYTFKEHDGSIIEGNSWPSVISLVVGYRRRNGFPMGNPVEEVIRQVAKRYPELVFEAP